MTVTVDQTGSQFDTPSSQTTYSNSTSINVGGSATALVVLVGTTTATGSPATGLTATWGGAPMTLITSIGAGDSAIGNGVVWIFGILFPKLGQQTLAFSWTNSNNLGGCAISFNGVNTTSVANAFPNATTATGAAATGLSLTVTSATGDIPLSVAITAGMSTPNQTQINLDSVNTDSIGSQRAAGVTGTPTNFTWTNTGGGKWGMCGCDVAAGAAVQSIIYPDRTEIIPRRFTTKYAGY